MSLATISERFVEVTFGVGAGDRELGGGGVVVTESSYQDNLPTHDVTSYHLRKVC